MIRTIIKRVTMELTSMPEVTLWQDNFFRYVYEESSWLERNCRDNYELLCSLNEDSVRLQVHICIYVDFKKKEDKTLFDLTWK